MSLEMVVDYAFVVSVEAEYRAHEGEELAESDEH